jgi:hypothetical protein
VSFALAIVAAEHAQDLPEAMAKAAIVHHGTAVNLLPDSTGDGHYNFDVGNTGLNGHEVCLEAPVGVTFVHDAHCAVKFANQDNPEGPPSPPVLYEHGTCIWTDADCNVCTGLNGKETVERWGDPGMLPPSPRFRITPGEHSIRVDWDNQPEVLALAGIAGRPSARFLGYHLYKLADWRQSRSQVAPSAGWSLLQAFYRDTTDGGASLGAVTDSALDYESILYEQKLYPPGRYSVVDREVLDGFDYAYSVSSVIEVRTVLPGFTRIEHFESPLVGSFQGVVRPRVTAGSRRGVWVVPNPYRGSAGWDRPNVIGGVPNTHLDFMGLPSVRSTIRVWTVAGDLVAQIEHDGSRGDGEASWNLVSRNGQDVVSGIYLFTVDSERGHESGRFVVIR